MSSKDVQLAISLFEAIDDVNLSNIIVLLNRYKTDPNVIIPKLQIAPIHFAVGFENVEFAEQVVALFLKKKADPNLLTECDSRLTPLHIAAIWGRSNIVKMLLDAGGDLSLKCSEGLTAILYAVQENHYEVIDVMKKFVFEQKIEKKKQELALRTKQAAAAVGKRESSNGHTPIKNSLSSALQHMEQKIFTPNRINYNFDATSPYYINITHRRRKTPTCENRAIDQRGSTTKSLSPPPPPAEATREEWGSEVKEEEEEGEEEQKNLFELTEKNLKAFSKQMNNVIVVERIAIHKRRSYIAEWREKIQQIRKSDKLDFSYINYLNACNDVTLLRGKSLTYSDQSEESEKDEVYEDVKSSSDSFVTANSDLQRKSNQVFAKTSNDLIDGKSSDYIENCEENYIHSDAASGVVLYERKILSKQQEMMNRMNDCAISDSSLSTVVTLPPLDYDTDTLRQELTSFGQNPGPITKHTKKLYLRKLVKIKKHPDRLGVVHEDSSRITYPLELQRTVTNYEYLEQNIGEFMKLETRMVRHFSEKSHLKWREGNSKTSFVYLLLDPRVTQNLSTHHQQLPKMEVWTRFVNSIFYVGKGKSSRPYHHLYDAIKIYKTNTVVDERHGNANNKLYESKKLKRIVDIWRENCGVVCLHVFHNIMPSEAYSREASVIEAIGIHNLTNMKKGDYYGAASSFSMKEKRQMGVSLLHRALHIYLAEGESQMKPDDF